MSKFVKENKKIIAIIGGVIVVVGVAIGVICATSDTKVNNKHNANVDNENIKQNKSFKECDYKINESDKQLLTAFIGELFFINEPNGLNRDMNNVSEQTEFYKITKLTDGIPSDDKSKMVLIQQLINCNYLFNGIIEYKISSDERYALIETECINSYLKQFIGSYIDDFDNIECYSLVNNQIEIPLGNRGDNTPVPKISSIRQINEKEVIIKGTVDHETGTSIVTGGSFTAYAYINKGSILGDLTINKFVIEESKEDSSNDDYILKDSNIKYLSDEDIKDLDKDVLEYARNEIYARHGYIFQTEKFKTYFKTKNWYKEDASFTGDDSQLNVFEKANRDLIMKYEKNFEEANNKSDNVIEDEFVSTLLSQATDNNEFPQYIPMMYSLKYYLNRYNGVYNNDNLELQLYENANEEGYSSCCLFDKDIDDLRTYIILYYNSERKGYDVLIREQNKDPISDWGPAIPRYKWFVDSNGNIEGAVK